MVGNEPANGSAPNFTMTLTNDAALVWLWTTNYWLAAAAGLRHGGCRRRLAARRRRHPNHRHRRLVLPLHQLDRLRHRHQQSPCAPDGRPRRYRANFTENLAASNTPEWWLALHGWTNDFDAAATRDAEPDGFFTWQEYIADTDPTNRVFPQARPHHHLRHQLPHPRLDRVFRPPLQVHRCDDLVDAVWLTQEVGLGTATWTDTSPPPPTNRYYRLAPRLP